MAEIKTTYIAYNQDPSLNEGKLIDCDHDFVDTKQSSLKLNRGSLVVDTLQRCSKCNQERIKRETEEKNY